MSIFMNLWLHRDKEPDSERDIVAEWADATFLANNEMTNYRAWFHVVMVFIFTFLTVYRVQVTRRFARASYKMTDAQ